MATDPSNDDDAILDEILKRWATYDAQLDEIYLFPEREHKEQVREIAAKWGKSEEAAWDDFLNRRPFGDWLRTFWARHLEPTQQPFHEITPIIARVRHGCATDREFDWLGQRIALAILLGEDSLLVLVAKLATKPIEYRASAVMTLAVFDYFDEHGRLPLHTELHFYVQNAKGAQAEKYELLTEDNWRRHLRRSGVSHLSRLIREESP